MTVWYVSDLDGGDYIVNLAGQKARVDVERILAQSSCKSILAPQRQEVSGAVAKIREHWRLGTLWEKQLNCAQKNDVVILQFPLTSHTLNFGKVARNLRKKGVHLVLLIHDLDSLRLGIRQDLPFATRVRVNLEETSVLKTASIVISHNQRMTEALAKSQDLNADNMVELGIFDYLYEGDNPNDFRQVGDGVAIAGNLRRHKASYVYQLPNDVSFNLYGTGYEEEGKPNISYKGSRPSEILPLELQGSFGLVWDGDSSQSCTGVYGEYLRVNNPHKTSLYLSAGLPVAIWKEAALAPFVAQNNAGVLIENLGELKEVLNSLSRDEYQCMLDATMQVSRKLRRGFFLRRAVDKALEKLGIQERVQWADSLSD